MVHGFYRGRIMATSAITFNASSLQIQICNNCIKFPSTMDDTGKVVIEVRNEV
jgi:hypothetical protein